MSERQLRINELTRQSKHSKGLVLEEHGNCEVPAGCGGVVLRWRNPDDGAPVRLWLLTQGTPQIRLDGAEVQTSRPILAYGTHALTIRLTDFPVDQGLLMFCARFSPQPVFRFDEKPEPGHLVCSHADGTWRYTTQPQADEAWQHTGFDDAAWSPMALRPMPEPAQKDYARGYRYRELLKLGAEALGTEMPAQMLYVRKQFTVNPDGLR